MSRDGYTAFGFTRRAARVGNSDQGHLVGRDSAVLQRIAEQPLEFVVLRTSGDRGHVTSAQAQRVGRERLDLDVVEQQPRTAMLQNSGKLARGRKHGDTVALGHARRLQNAHHAFDALAERRSHGAGSSGTYPVAPTATLALLGARGSLCFDIPILRRLERAAQVQSRQILGETTRRQVALSLEPEDRPVQEIEQAQDQKLYGHVAA